MRLAVGGVAATAMRLHKSEEMLLGKKINDTTKALLLKAIQEEIKPLDDLRGSAHFRRVLLDGVFERYWDEHVRAANEVP